MIVSFVPNSPWKTAIIALNVRTYLHHITLIATLTIVMSGRSRDANAEHPEAGDDDVHGKLRLVPLFEHAGRQHSCRQRTQRADARDD
jgi:hypothetical protein